MQQTPMLRSAIVLGLMSAVGPFAIDMYLPAMPAIAADLDTTVAGTQATLTAFFLAFGIAQLVYGPVSDRYGRKPPVFAGLALFILASLGCAMAGSVEALIGYRFLQGLGAAVVMVIPRAIIRDMHTGSAATRLMAMVMLVISVSPMLAPLAGSGLLLLGSWRMLFYVFCVAALGSLLMAGTLLPETLAPDQRRPINGRALLRGAATLLRDPKFMGLTFVGGFGMASFFVFIASASFVFTRQFGLTPTGFSVAFAINAVGFFGASQMAAPLGDRLGAPRLVTLAVAGFAACTVTLLAVALAGLATLPVIVAGLFCANACLGLVIPTVMVMALDDHGDMAGLASSLGGTLQMMAGGLMITVAGPFFDGTALPMIAAIAVCGLCALALSQLVVARLPRSLGAS